MKKEWTKPKLISLYRGRPEEAVLESCKLEFEVSAGPFQSICGFGADCTGLVSS